MTDADRFMARCTIQEDTQCWVFKTKSGKRPLFHSKMNGEYLGTTAARAAYEIFIGEVPHGENVVRACSTKWCVNPHHQVTINPSDYGKLAWGTALGRLLAQRAAATRKD